MKKAIAVFLLIILNLFLFVPGVSAKVVSMEAGTYTVSESEVIDDDLFVGAKSVEIYGTVNGDVYVGAETVRVNGTINGDLLVGAGSVFLSGTVEDDVYIGSGNVIVTEADIGDSLLVGTGNLSIDKDTVIGGSLLSGAGNVSTRSQVQRNVMIGAGNVDLDSEIGGEVRIGGGQITVGPNTKVGKDFTYTLGEDGSELNMSEGASVSGVVKEYESKYVDTGDWEKTRKDLSAFARGADVVSKTISYLGALIVGLLFLRFMPKKLNGASGKVTGMFWKSFGLGLLASLLILPVLILVSITIIGIPLAGITFLMFLIKTYLAKIVVGVSLGGWLSAKFSWKKISMYLSFALGLLSVYVLKSLPVVGFLLSLTILWTGLGAQLLHYKEKLSK